MQNKINYGTIGINFTQGSYTNNHLRYKEENMKRILILTLCIISFLLFLPKFVYAEGEQTVILKVGSSGDEVINLQMRLRDLGYYNYKITGFYGGVTQESVGVFQQSNKLQVDGTVGQETSNFLYSNQAKRHPVVAEGKQGKGMISRGGSTKIGQMLDWFKTVNGMFPKGSAVTVIDFETGVSYRMIRVGGSNHADVEPATKTDCKKLLESFGDSWSWERRAVLVKFGSTFIAGSINGLPHGYETIPNNDMNGQVCIHFLNSRTHIHDAKDPDHQAMVRKAAGK